MTRGIGGSDLQTVLASFQNRTADMVPIQGAEHKTRLEQATALLQANDLAAIYLHAGANLLYFTGMKWKPSERMVGALLTASGQLQYIGPAFEAGTIKSFMKVDAPLQCWEEHESPAQLLGAMLKDAGIPDGRIAVDESVPFFISESLRATNPSYELVDATPVTAGCRMCKSEAEIALIQRAKDITLAVQKAAARIMHPGIAAKTVIDFINEAHIRSGIAAGSYFCTVLFGEDTQYPHGVPAPQPLQNNDVVLVDTGCQLHGYISDITRTYVYGTPTARQREIWQLEKAAQLAAFDAAQPGATCASVDDAARRALEAAGLGPDYKLPGLPHRTGHGTGLEIHEHPYLVRSDQTPLQKGMVLSVEPMICVPGAFGIRHEDHFYMTKTGPRWFTQPMPSLEAPFSNA
ncbi:MAG: Xaa-Pro peptidase family protein [Bacteroidota bacterium]